MEPRELGKISDHAYDRIGSDRLTDEEKTQIENAVRIAWGRRDCLSLTVVCKDLGKEYREAEDGSNGNLIIATIKSGGKYHHDGELVTVMLRSDRQLVKKGMLECSHLAWMVPKRPTGEHARKQQRKQRRFLNRR